MSVVTLQFGSNGRFAGKSRKLHVGELVRNYASAWRVEQLEGEAKLAEGSGEKPGGSLNVSAKNA